MGECYINFFAVHRNCSRRGIVRLMVEVLKFALSLVHKKAELINIVSNGNRIKYLRTFGFADVRISKCFGHDYLKMGKDFD